MNSDDILDTSQLCYEGDFDTQVDNLLNHVRLTANEVRSLRNVFADLEQALQSLAPGLEVFPFGSIITGLGIRTSDIDCFIALPPGTIPDKRYVMQARNILKRYNGIFSNVFAIANAKVPIVKFLHVPTNCNCDINFKSPSGVQNSELVSFLLNMDRSGRALKLAVIIKYWSKVHRFTGTNFLASYALTLMVIFYLQLLGMLPSVCEMQRKLPLGMCMLNNWNTGFDMSVTAEPNNDSLYDLLGGFFKSYASINFEEYIISPFVGQLINKQLFKTEIGIPSEFVHYKANIASEWCQPLNVDLPMCVQDVFEHGNNCASSVHPKLAAIIKAHFEFAAKKFDEVPPEDFLCSILTEGPAIARKLTKKSRHVINNKVIKFNKILNYKNRKPKRYYQMVAKVNLK